MEERRGKKVKVLFKRITVKSQPDEGRGKVMERVVERWKFVEFELLQGVREVIERLVEGRLGNSKRDESGGEVVDGVVKFPPKSFRWVR